MSSYFNRGSSSRFPALVCILLVAFPVLVSGQISGRTTSLTDQTTSRTLLYETSHYEQGPSGILQPKQHVPQTTTVPQSPEHRPIQQAQPGPLKRHYPTEQPIEKRIAKPADEPKTSPRLAPEPLPLAETKQQAEKVLAAGKLLEQQKLWSEAVSHYQSALKTFHNDPMVRERYQIARFHYEVNRRCVDTTYEQLLRQSTLGEVLWMFEHALSTIKDNYIDTQNWETLFHSGLQNLEIALSEPVFLKINGITATPGEINETCRKMRELSQPWSFFNMENMKNGVLNVADLAQREIGLPINTTVFEFFIGAANSLDPNSFYLTLHQWNDWCSQIDGRFVGIGIETDCDAYSLFIAGVLPNSPAEQAGLAEGDRILTINGKSTIGLSLEESLNMLQGQSGSRVVLNIGTEGRAEREVAITRREIEVTSVETVCKLNNDLGYIRLIGFQNNTVDDMKKAYHQLLQEGIRGLVIDLRQNGGGVLTAGVGVANLFLDKGVILRTQDRSQQAETVYSATASGTWNIPLIVLIDEESASAAEIFAGAIRDHKRGILIGKQSFGKGTAQQFFNQNLPNRSTVAGLKITTERFYSPNGLSCNGVGIMPDVVLEDEPQEERVQVNKPDFTIRQEKQNGKDNSFVKITPTKRKRIRTTIDDPYIAAAIQVSRSQLEQQRFSSLSP